MSAPTAEVVAVRGDRVTVTCPYCGTRHAHKVTRPGLTEHRAPGCGLYLSAEQRIAGYVFTTPTTNKE